MWESRSYVEMQEEQMDEVKQKLKKIGLEIAEKLNQAIQDSKIFEIHWACVG